MFKIGDFSRLSRVSIRMLRHYDQLGLLKPSRIDPITNYRYYSADQLPRLNRIIALHDLGFSLEQIGVMLADGLSSEQLLGMFKLKHADVERQMRTVHQQYLRLEARIRQLSESSQPGDYAVILRNIEPTLVAAIREVVADDGQIERMFEEVETYVSQFDQARADMPPFIVYYDEGYQEEKVDAEVAVPLGYSIPDGDRVCIREMPSIISAACVVHTGSYASLFQAHNALLAWIEANDYRMAGPIREVYLRYGADQQGYDLSPAFLAKASKQYITELQLPVEKG